jgi:4a-hydroxytetrahydrobiopterin dehydratase
MAKATAATRRKTHGDMSPPLTEQECSPEAKRLPTLPAARRRALHKQVPQWVLTQKSLSRTWELKDFTQVLGLVDRIGGLAEREGHHPDLHIESYRNLRAVLTTHAAGGLTMNDFILAAKIDQLTRTGRRPTRARPLRRMAAKVIPGLRPK